MKKITGGIIWILVLNINILNIGIKKTICSLVLVLFLSFGLVAQVSWNNGGGNPGRNGFVSADGPVIKNLLWQINSIGLNGMPVYIEGNKLVTMRFRSMTNAPIVCYDLTNGNLLWEKEITGLTARSLPIGVRNNQVYAVMFTDTYYDTLVALDLNTGNRIWKSNVKVSVFISASASFASNGDLFVERADTISRINYQTGQAIWNISDTHGFVSGCLEMSVNNSNNTGYIMEQKSGGVAYVTAINLTTGTKKYSHIINNTHPGGGVNQVPIIVGTNGVIYAHKQGDNITALQDNGSSLTLLWEREINGERAFSIIGVGSDGSVYAPNNDKIIRINPTNGNIIGTTTESVFTTQYGIIRISATQNNMIYFTNGENEIYAYDLNLNLKWSDNIPNNNTSGVAFGSNGLIAVAGTDVIKVYNTVVNLNDNNFNESVSVYPNPFSKKLIVNNDKPAVNSVYKIIDPAGCILISGKSDSQNIVIETENLKNGLYFLIIEDANDTKTYKVIKE